MFTIYHNPRCRKSRETLELLRSHGIEPTIRLYLEEPPTTTELKQLETLLGKQISEFTRKHEDVYKKLKPKDSELIDIVAKYPILLERPIVVKDNKKAVIGRPPENVLQLLS